MFMSALNQTHVFRALSTGYVRGLTGETPLKKAKAVVEVFNSEHNLSVDGTAGWRAPSTPEAETFPTAAVRTEGAQDPCPAQG